uniref:Sugar transferase n=1 Tax=Cyanothece sp. (strain PCC 7425 / ATCC 29141) TaxID=395961 RepID=B8HT86_CYAP4
MNGICTLANDRVYDQLLALLNSIEAILGTAIPVCIYPFDEQTERIQAELKHRPQVQLYNDAKSVQRWDDFVLKAAPGLSNRTHRLYGAHRRFCAFDGPFERFIYMDADTVVMGPLDRVFQSLEQYGCVTYDFQFVHPDKVYNLNSPRLYQIFTQNRIHQEIFCSGFYASKQRVFTPEKLQWLIEQLQAGEREILYTSTRGEQPLLNYMFMRSNIFCCNLAHFLPDIETTGTAVTSTHFETVDHILYDRGRRLTYLHYIGINPEIMERVCQGENIAFPYRDIFLHYRYLHEPEKRPIFSTPGKPYNYQPNFWERGWSKLKRIGPSS